MNTMSIAIIACIKFLYLNTKDFLTNLVIKYFPYKSYFVALTAAWTLSVTESFVNMLHT